MSEKQSHNLRILARRALSLTGMALAACGAVLPASVATQRSGAAKAPAATPSVAASVSAAVDPLPARSSRDFAATSSAVTLVAEIHFGSPHPTTLGTRHLTPAGATVMITALNALLPDDGAIRGCAADTQQYRIQIEIGVGGSPLVFSDWPACSLVLVTSDGIRVLILSASAIFQNEVTRLIGFPPVP